MTARKGGSSRAPAVSSTAATAGPFVSTCHVLASQPLMAAGSSSRFPGKPREDGLTCRPPSLSSPQFRGPTSGPDAPGLPRAPAWRARTAVQGPRPRVPLLQGRCHVSREWAGSGPGGGARARRGRGLGLNSEDRSWLLWGGARRERGRGFAVFGEGAPQPRGSAFAHVSFMPAPPHAGSSGGGSPTGRS